MLINIVRKTQQAGKWQNTYLFISNYREKVVWSALCGDVTETWLHLLFEGAKQGEVRQPSLHRVSLCLKRSEDVPDL